MKAERFVKETAGVRRPLLQLLLALVLLAVLAGIGWATREYVPLKFQIENKIDPSLSDLAATKLKFDDEVLYTNPYRIETGRDDSIYVIDDSRQTITKRNDFGTLEYVLHPEDLYHERILVNYTDLAVDPHDRLYVHKSMMDINGLSNREDQIVRYTKDGEIDPFWKTITVPYDVKLNASLRNGGVKNLQIKDGFLYWFTIRHWELTLYKTALDGGGTPIEVLKKTLPEGAYLDEVIGTDPSEIVYSTKKGEIYTLDGKLLYPLQGNKEGDTFLNPYSIHFDVLHNLYFLDHYGAVVKRLPLERPEAVETVYTPKDGKLLTMEIDSNGTLVFGLEDRITSLIEGELEPLRHSTKTHVYQVLFWIGCLLFLAIWGWMTKIVYVDLVPRSIVAKQLLYIGPAIVVAMSLLAGVMYLDFQEDMYHETARGLYHMAHMGQNLVDGETLAQIQSPKDFREEPYNRLKERLTFQDDFGKFYSVAYLRRDGVVYQVLEDANDLRMFEPLSSDVFQESVCEYRDAKGQWQELKDDYSFVLEDGQYASCVSEDENGSWMFVLGPVFDSQKQQVVGIYETGIHLRGFEARLAEMRGKILTVIAAFTGVVLVLFLAFTMWNLTPLRRLSLKVKEMAAEKEICEVEVTTRDEVGLFGTQFNVMAQNIRDEIEKNERLRKAAYRFVPKQYLDYLGKEEITEIDLGDQVRKTMSILTMRIRNFSELSKSMKDAPNDNFDFINAFIARVSNVLHENGGLINTYQGHQIVALFPDSPLSALTAAVAMRREIAAYNETRAGAGRLPVDISIGLQTGDLMLGIIGDDYRYEGTAISEDVHVSGMLDRVTTQLGSSVLIPKAVLNSVEPLPDLAMRDLGRIKLPGMDEPMELCDLYETDDPELRRLKHKTKDDFENAVRMYQQSRFRDARFAFVQLLKENQRDEAARLYFYVCDEYSQRGAPSDWDGSLELHA
ncbi:hypothetical protein OS242_09955 [Tumebacillus sp. DT12]|uniref:HAMP domain-containing protein n=1 Tax=Tumebacillus lacus TaxID=2995335 RepID=A0ABT3X055_9BACL|nr:hypothetical protein [Tumebacillus lacus]MCX7570286.1 hypothetical protein [Tumebacillus lacus]